MDNTFFDKLQDTVIMAGAKAGQTAKELTERAKLQYEIRTRESYLGELYKELGKDYYARHKDDEDADFDEIENLLEELSDLHQQMADRRGARRCPVCNSLVPAESDYCGKCGRFVAEDEE